MRLWQFSSSAAPVNSFRADPIAPRPPVPAPDVGLRWGRPSSFSYSNERDREDAQDAGGVTVELPATEPPHYMRIFEADLLVQAELALVEHESGETVGIDRLKRMAFRYTELMPKATPAHPQPERTTYYDLTFELHPPIDKESTG